DYREKLSASSNALYQAPLGEMMTLYKAYVGETYEAASFESLRAKYLASAKNHSAKNKEDLKTIARSYFQDEGLAQSLALFNQLDKNAVLKAGQKILVPDKAYFEELASQERRILAQRDESRGYSEHTVLSNETWSSVALAFLGDKKLEDGLISFNQKNKTDKLIGGQVIRIPLRTKTREAAETAFWNKLDAKRDEFIKTKPSEMERIFFEGLYEKMRGKVSVFQFKNALATEKDATATSLGNLLNERKAQFARSRDGLIKDLDRIKLKKQLDNLNASGEKAKAAAQQDYKKKERAIFESLLLAIYDSKTLFIEKFRKAAQKNLEDKISSQKRMAGAQTDALAKYEKVALLEAGKDQTRVKGLQEAFAKQKSDLEAGAAAELDKTREEFRRIGNELDWRSYMTEMIYRGSTEKRDTLAFGVAVKNIGTELNYGRKSETQPFVFSADMNYELLHLEHHGLILYGHYGYSIFEDHHSGFGFMYRLLNRFEIRSGLVMENLTSKAVLVASGGLAMNLELGLMNYRIDFSAQLREIVGPSFTVGLNVIF
ncbi:MAG: LysM peptidoglycan-binding domain-containing protein, partial [Spirochaetia bacterium]|nr:LysM peptidoglycan-binding domain-containing protein [Spirochaetia bacterium]